MNNVDLKHAEKLGLKVISVPSYSPSVHQTYLSSAIYPRACRVPRLMRSSHAVAEFTVGLILTTVRKYHKAYNRVREGDFTLSGILNFLLHKHPETHT
jgi:D-lactate dehydrogenase